MKTAVTPTNHTPSNGDQLVSSITIGNQTDSVLFLSCGGNSVNVNPGGVEILSDSSEPDIQKFGLIKDGTPLVEFEFITRDGKTVLGLGSDSPGWTASPIEPGAPIVFFNETFIVWFKAGSDNGFGGIAMVGTVSTISPRM